MKITKITNGILNQNCYVLSKDGQAIVIDPGIDTKLILNTISDLKVKVDYVILTHGHFDHIYSANALKELGAKVLISEEDAPKLLDSEINMGFLYNFNDMPKCLPDEFLVEGEKELLGEKFEIIETPGHTSGSVCIIYKDNIFTGDTYFSEGVYGRTDLLDGSTSKLVSSLLKLKPYLVGRTIYPGHE